MNAIVNAARRKYRFPSAKGAITFEQLWDLPLQSKSGFDLDSVAQDLDLQIQASARTSFVDKGSNPAKTELEEKLSLVVYVIETVQAENAAKRNAAAKQAERETLVEALHDKKKSEILGLSTEELERRIAALS